MVRAALDAGWEVSLYNRGKSARDLFQKLKEFQSGEEGDGLMAAHARGYTDAQLRALARYLARQR